VGYLIKDLSKLTGVKGFTIRKWQERYGIFEPELASNGYWYYSNDDYTVLTKIIKLLESGERISNVVSIGREKLLNLRDDSNYSSAEKLIISWIQKNQYIELGKYLDSLYQPNNFTAFIRNQVESVVILTGRAWQDGLLGVGDEHSFSRWMTGYLRQKCADLEEPSSNPLWLVTVFPGETHELGALMHYAILIGKKIPAKFVGTLPVEHIIKELNKGNYRTVSVSMVLAPPLQKIEKLKKNLLSKSKVKKVFFGGRGFKLAKYGICRER
jgi:DNA-binding transcriptional MerR regulator